MDDTNVSHFCMHLSRSTLINRSRFFVLRMANFSISMRDGLMSGNPFKRPTMLSLEGKSQLKRRISMFGLTCEMSWSSVVRSGPNTSPGPLYSERRSIYCAWLGKILRWSASPRMLYPLSNRMYLHKKGPLRFRHCRETRLNSTAGCSRVRSGVADAGRLSPLKNSSIIMMMSSGGKRLMVNETG